MVKIPPMFLQPIVENSIEHGFVNIQNPRIIVKVEEKEDYLVFSIYDNGIGVEHSKSLNTKKQSISTQVMQERLKAFSRNRKKKLNYSITTREENGNKGTEVKIELPILT